MHKLFAEHKLIQTRAENLQYYNQYLIYISISTSIKKGRISIVSFIRLLHYSRFF